MNSNIPRTSLIVIADDFGYSKAINKGIFRTINYGIVTCVSIMVLKRYFLEVRKIIKNKNISIGIHLEPKFDSKNNYSYFKEQIILFTEKLGYKPIFISLHWSSRYSNVNLSEIKKIHFYLMMLSKKFEIPLRRKIDLNCSVLQATDSLKETKNVLLHKIDTLSSGLNGLIVHPGNYPDKNLKSSYSAKKRFFETIALTSKEVACKLEKRNIILCNYQGRCIHKSEK